MRFGCIHYCATETALLEYVLVSVHMTFCVCADARLSPAEEAQCVGVEVEGESRHSLYKSGQITEAERPATPFHCPVSSALCQLTHTPGLYGLVGFILAANSTVPGL